MACRCISAIMPLNGNHGRLSYPRRRIGGVRHGKRLARDIWNGWPYRDSAGVALTAFVCSNVLVIAAAYVISPKWSLLGLPLVLASHRWAFRTDALARQARVDS